jgi:hypothetical protein
MYRGGENLEPPHLLLEGGAGLPAETHPDVIGEPLSHGQLEHDRNAVSAQLVGRADPAAEEDSGRSVCARGENDRPRSELAAARDHAKRVEDDPVGERVGKDREVRPTTRRIEIRDCGIPANRSPHVDGVGNRAGPAEKGGVPGRELLLVEPADAQVDLGSVQVRLHLGVRPAGAPLVVVRRSAAEDDAGIVGRAPAENPGAELGAVLTIRLPRVAEGERPPIEEVAGPATLRVGAVVGAGLDEADGAAGILRQASGKRAPAEPPPRTSTS